MSTLTETRPTVNANDGNRIDGIPIQPNQAIRDPSQLIGYRVNLDHSEPRQRVSYSRRIGRVVGAAPGNGGIVASVVLNPGHESAAALLHDVSRGLSSFVLRPDVRSRSLDLITTDAPAQPTPPPVVESADLVEDSSGGHVDSNQDLRRQLLRNPAKILSSWRRQHLQR
jgi:hypothetical protein